jgi:hypothetical protein
MATQRERMDRANAVAEALMAAPAARQHDETSARLLSGIARGASVSAGV